MGRAVGKLLGKSLRSSGRSSRPSAKPYGGYFSSYNKWSYPKSIHTYDSISSAPKRGTYHIISTSGRTVKYGGASTTSIHNRLTAHKLSGILTKGNTVVCYDMKRSSAKAIGKAEKNMNSRLNPRLNKYRGGNGIH